MRHSRLVAVAIGALLSLPATARAQDHIYYLNNVFSDTKGGPSLVPLGGSIGASGFSFAKNDGLSLSLALGSTYTIAMQFRFDNVDGYRRILDFKERASDNGPYALSGASNFYNVATGPTSPYVPNQLGLSVFTRDATGQFSAYVGGVSQYSFLDNTGLGVQSGSTVRFFQDDLAVQNEASAGFVNYIATWNTALTAEQVAAFSPGRPGTLPVTTAPEPATLALLAAGVLSIGALRQRSSRMA